MRIEARAIWRRAVLCAIVGFAPGACSSNRAPRADAAPAAKASPAPATDGDVADAAGETRSNAARFNIPPGYLPPPGMCRVWVPGQPPGQQEKEHPVGRCSTLRTSIPADAWLVYRPTDDPRHVRVWQYGANGEVRAQRIYDIATGELVRHVAPASGG